MTSHDLARQLLALPDLLVVSGLSRSGYGEEVLSATVMTAFEINEEGGRGESDTVIELTLSDITARQV